MRSRRTREITGPTPHSVAVRGKPTLRRPREHLILERRKQEELREEANSMVHYNKQFDLKTSWERTTDKKIQLNTVQRRMEGLLQQQQYSLEERRDKLRSLLQSEEAAFHCEITGQQETVLERQAKMRERARMLKEKRETERLEIAEQKLDQRWRNQCEELRATVTKRHQDQVCRERAEQVHFKQVERRHKEQEEQMYAQLWEEDRQAKCHREEMEAALQIERNREMLQVLTLQKSAIDKQKEEMLQLREQEAELLKEDAALRAVEQQRMQQEKRRRQESTKSDLDFSLKLKMKKRAKEEQEELAMDMKILEQMLAESTNEAMQGLQKKNQLREEIKCYRGYLAEQAREEERMERELDSLVTAEVAKQWAKRVEQWRREKEARKKLMQDVIDTRRKQIEEKLAVIEQEKRAAQKEREALLANFEQHKQLHIQQEEEKRKSNLVYQNNLLQQMDYQQKLKELEVVQSHRELELCKEAELAYQQRVQRALERPHPDKIHPRRLLSERIA